MQEWENVLRIFKETKEAVQKEDSAKISSLSNQTNNTAALTNDPDNIAAAVIVYALGKIIERKQYYEKLPGWKKFYSVYLSTIDKIISSIEKHDDAAYDQNIKKIRAAIGEMSGKLKGYIQDVFRKASINKASKLYEHGISMEKTAALLGITLYDVAEYAGSKEGLDIPQSKDVDVRARIKMAMEMFG